MNDNTWTGIYAATNLPVGLTIEENTGAISGTPTVVSAKADYTITLTGTNNSEGVDGNATVSITILPPAPLSLTATQSKITDGTTNNGTKKLPSNFMIFDITPAQEVSRQIPIEFLLVRDGDAAPTNLEQFRKTVTLNLKEGGTYSNHEVVMAYQSILAPVEQTSLYLAHDSEGRYPLSPDTDYRLYVVQPNSSAYTPVSLGSFRTGSYVDPNLYPDMKYHIESLAGSEHTGTFYMKKEQFFVLVSLFGQSVGNDPGFSLRLNSIVRTVKHDNITGNDSLIWDSRFDGTSKPFPFFHALILPANMMPDPPSVASFFTDIIYIQSPDLEFKMFE